MRVLILHDQKAGHMSQTKAIVAALRRHHEVEESWCLCKLRAGLFQRPLRACFHAGRMPPASWFRGIHRGDKLPDTKPDLILSAGGGTMYANVWLARLWNVPNLFCGHLRGVPPALFRGVVTHYDHYGTQPPFLFSATPVPVEPAELEQAEASFRQRHDLGETRCWSLLVGGRGAGYHYSPADWEILIRSMIRLAECHDIRWLVSTSRRTGESAETLLWDRLSGHSSIAALVLAGRRVGNASYLEVLGSSERLFCTEDSHMMISEAIATGHPVHSLQPEHFRTIPSNEHFLSLYQRQGWLERMAIRDLASATFAPVRPDMPGRRPVIAELGDQLAAWWTRQAG